MEQSPRAEVNFAREGPVHIMPATTRDVEFTVPESGLPLIVGYTLPGGLYRGSITVLYSDTDALQVTILISAATMHKMGIDLHARGPLASTQGQRIDITADYNSGAIRENQR